MIDGGWACSVCEVARKGFLCFVLSVHTSYYYICASLLAVHLKIPPAQNEQWPILTGENWSSWRKICPITSLSTSDLTWIGLGLNMGFRSERGTNWLSYGRLKICRVIPRADCLWLKNILLKPVVKEGCYTQVKIIAICDLCMTGRSVFCKCLW